MNGLAGAGSFTFTEGKQGNALLPGSTRELFLHPLLCMMGLGMGPGGALDMHTHSEHPRAGLLCGSRGSVWPSLGSCWAKEMPRAVSSRGQEEAKPSSLPGACAVHAVGALSAAGQGLGSVWSLGRSPCSASPLLAPGSPLGCSAHFTCSVPPGRSQQRAQPIPLLLVLSSDCPPHCTPKTELSTMPA